ncbi:unnamed protein product, partial [Symbiodinium sp. KB8]
LLYEAFGCSPDYAVALLHSPHFLWSLGEASTLNSVQGGFSHESNALLVDDRWTKPGKTELDVTAQAQLQSVPVVFVIYHAELLGVLVAHKQCSYLQIALRRQLRLPSPLCPNRCGPGPGCGQIVDAYGDRALPRKFALERQLHKARHLDVLHDVDLLDELRQPVPTLQTVPVFVRAGVRRAFASSLQHLRAAYSGPPDDHARARTWKLFLLTPRMLLTRPAEWGGDGRRVFLMRLQRYEQGLWPALLVDARATRASLGQRPTSMQKRFPSDGEQPLASAYRCRARARR